MVSQNAEKQCFSFTWSSTIRETPRYDQANHTLHILVTKGNALHILVTNGNTLHILVTKGNALHILVTKGNACFNDTRVVIYCKTYRISFTRKNEFKQKIRVGHKMI